MPLNEEQARAQIDAVLSGPPFEQESTVDEWWPAFLKRLLELWDREVGDLAFTDPIIFWTTIAILVAVLALLGWHVTYTLRRVLTTVGGEPLPQAEGSRPLDRSLARARAALARGDVRSAVETTWDTIMHALNADPTANTPRRQARSVRDGLPTGDRDALQGLLRLHESVCYAGSQPTAESGARAIELGDALLINVQNETDG